MVDSNMDQVLQIYLQNGPSETHVRTLNKLLSTSKTFAEGLELLKSILNYCTVEFLIENVNWLDHCLIKHPVENLAEIKLSVIGKFLEASFSNQELSKKISSDYLSKICEFCLTNKSNCYEIQASLDVLTVCMKKYSSWFIHHKTRIEVHILSFLDNSSDCIVEKSAIAFLYLQQVGNAGTENINHRNNFRIALQKLCCTAHNLLDIFLQNEIEVDHVQKLNQEGFSFEELSYGSQKTLNITAQRVKNVISFLKVMIQKNFAVQKEIVPIEILNLIARGMTHHCVDTLAEKSTENYQFCLLQNNIQVQLLHLLRVLILWLQNSSFPYAFNINKILLDCLKRSQKCKCFSLNCVYQETTYMVLKCWLNISKCALNSHFQTELINCIMKDITPLKMSVTLKMQSEATKTQGNKRKSKQNIFVPSRQAPNEVNKSKYEVRKDELRCQLALDTLSTLFYSTFIRVEKRVIEDVYTLIMNTFNEIITSKPPHPYGNHLSRVKLHELLVSFYEQETLKTLPFIAQSLNILNNSLCMKNNDMASICKQGLNNLERLCQPIATPFSRFIALSTQPSNDTEQIIGDNIGLIECITEYDNSDDIIECLEKSPKKELGILENQTVKPISDTRGKFMNGNILEQEEIIDNIVVAECIADITESNTSEDRVEILEKSTKKEINILQNQIVKPISELIKHSMNNTNFPKQVNSGSSVDENILEQKDLRNNSDKVNNINDVNQTTSSLSEHILSKIESPSIHGINGNNSEKFHEPAIKRLKIEEGKPADTPVNSNDNVTTSVNTMLEELNTFVDEIKED